MSKLDMGHTQIVTELREAQWDSKIRTFDDHPCSGVVPGLKQAVCRNVSPALVHVPCPMGKPPSLYQELQFRTGCDLGQIVQC
jgi:hypothetical protein